MRRLLLVHAHPDDETIGTGGTIARSAAEGAQVAVVTCTLGEQGEIILPALQGLAADRADQLGGYRIGELRAALAELGPVEQVFLGGAGRFRDSGMAGEASARHPRAFARTPADPAALDALVALIDSYRPHVVVGYGPDGGYGHPDHVRAHEVTTAAVAGASWPVPKAYWTVTPRRELADGHRALLRDGTPFTVVDPADLGFGVPDADVTTVVDVREYLPRKAAALAAHATQVSVADGSWALSNGIARAFAPTESFRLVRGTAAPGPDGLEHDLFAGLADG